MESNKKTRPVSNPYETYVDPALPGWEWRVLKHYQNPIQEEKNPYARVFCAVKSPFTFGSWEYGDTYIKELGKQKRPSQPWTPKTKRDRQILQGG